MTTPRTLALFAAFALAAILLPQAAQAISIWGIPPGFWGPILTCHGLECKSLCDIFDTGQRIIYLMMSLLIFAFAPLLFVIGGGTILFAGADPGMLSQGKKILTGTLIGVGISLGAFLIVDQVFSAIASLSSVQIDWRNIQCEDGLPRVTPERGGQGSGTQNP